MCVGNRKGKPAWKRVFFIGVRWNRSVLASPDLIGVLRAAKMGFPRSVAELGWEITQGSPSLASLWATKASVIKREKKKKFHKTSIVSVKNEQKEKKPNKLYILCSISPQIRGTRPEEGTRAPAAGRDAAGGWQPAGTPRKTPPKLKTGGLGHILPSLLP